MGIWWQLPFLQFLVWATQTWNYGFCMFVPVFWSWIWELSVPHPLLEGGYRGIMGILAATNDPMLNVFNDVHYGIFLITDILSKPWIKEGYWVSRLLRRWKFWTMCQFSAVSFQRCVARQDEMLSTVPPAYTEPTVPHPHNKSWNKLYGGWVHKPNFGTSKPIVFLLISLHGCWAPVSCEVLHHIIWTIWPICCPGAQHAVSNRSSSRRILPTTPVPVLFSHASCALSSSLAAAAWPSAPRCRNSNNGSVALCVVAGWLVCPALTSQTPSDQAAKGVPPAISWRMFNIWGSTMENEMKINWNYALETTKNTKVHLNLETLELGAHPHVHATLKQRCRFDSGSHHRTTPR